MLQSKIQKSRHIQQVSVEAASKTWGL